MRILIADGKISIDDMIVDDKPKCVYHVKIKFKGSAGISNDIEISTTEWSVADRLHQLCGALITEVNTDRRFK